MRHIHHGEEGADSETDSAALPDPGGREEKYGDFLARVFQHEFDHVQGMVFLDWVESSLEFVTEKEYRRLQIHA